jgi:hypothetical protein
LVFTPYPPLTTGTVGQGWLGDGAGSALG